MFVLKMMLASSLVISGVAQVIIPEGVNTAQCPLDKFTTKTS
jgi:hypothetical protein